MNGITDEHKYLLQSVKQWFKRPEQIRHYKDEIYQGPTPAERWLLNKLPVKGSVLDFGCGAGRISIYLAEMGYHVTAVDISEELLNIASKETEKKGLNINYRLVDGLTLPFRDNEFDALIAFKVLCYIPTRDLRHQYLQELYRILKSGGTCLITQYISFELISFENDENYQGTGYIRLIELKKPV